MRLVRSLRYFQDRVQAVKFALKLARPDMPPAERILIAAAYGEAASPSFWVDASEDGNIGCRLEYDPEAFAPVLQIELSGCIAAVAVCSVRSEGFPLRVRWVAVDPLADAALATALLADALSLSPVVQAIAETEAEKRSHEAFGFRYSRRVGDGAGCRWLVSNAPLEEVRYGVPVIEDYEDVLLANGMMGLLSDISDANAAAGVNS